MLFALALSSLGPASALPTAPHARVKPAAPDLEAHVKGKRRPVFDRSTVLVRFQPGTPSAVRRRVLERHGAAPGRHVAATGFVLASTETRPAAALVAALRAHPRVAEAVLNYRRSVSDTPNDPLYATSQGYLDALRMPSAWDLGHGDEATTVAVVDTGVDLNHPDLEARIRPGHDFVNDDDEAWDDEGHGTMVAGIAAAQTNNGIGVAGVGWTAGIMPVKVLDANGSGWDSDVAAGITWAADHGADVINLSLGGPAPSAALQSAVNYACSKDVVVVAAAGNAGTSAPSYPAAYPCVTAVAATDAGGSTAWFSNYGWWVDIAAPGVDVTSTALIDGPGEAYASGSGTSFAAPVVAGLAALVRSADPDLPRGAVAMRVERAAQDRGSPGLDRFFGFGSADGYAALRGPRPAPIDPVPDRGEPNGTLDRAAPVALGGSAEGTIAPEGDIDWYATEVSSPSWLSITVTPPPASETFRAKEMDPVISVYGPNATLIATRDAGFIGDAESFVVPAASAGRYAIEVANYYGAQSPGPYTVTVALGESPRGFAAYKNYPVGSWPESVAIADVTGDGKKDVLMTTSFYFDAANDYKLFLFPQQESGSLGTPTRYPTHAVYNDSRGLGVATGDLDGDGKADVAVATLAGIDIFTQEAGSLAGPTLVNAATQARTVEIADMDGDGDNDMVVTVNGGIVLLANTDVGFEAASVSAQETEEAEVGDLNGDGRLDIAGFRGDTVHVYAQNADATWASGTPYEAVTGSWPSGEGLEVAELTGDGRADVALTIGGNRPGSLVNVFAQNGSGTLDAPRVYQSYDIPEPLEAADMTGDGRADLVTLHGGWTAAGIHAQQASGLLGAEQLFAVPYASHYNVKGLALGDVSGDERPDIAEADYNHGLVVLRQLGPQAPQATDGPRAWIRDTAPSENALDVATDAHPTLTFARDVSATSLTPANVRLVSGGTGASVPVTLAYDTAAARATIVPSVLAAGTAYTLVVSGLRDASGQTMTGEFSFSFRTGPPDLDAPETTITAAPPALARTRSASLSFASSEDASTFECSFDGGPFTVCASPAVSGELVDGAHVFRVRATDPAGNVDQSPAVFNWSVDTSATPGGPVVSLRVGSQIGRARIPILLEWEHNDSGALDRYDVERSDDGGATWTPVGVVPSSAPGMDASVASGTRYLFRVRGVDGVGTPTAWVVGEPARVLVYQESSARIRYHGAWNRVRSRSASGGYLKSARARGAYARLTFSGRAIGWVTRTSRTHGRAAILVDALREATVDTWSSSPRARRLVAAYARPSTGEHALNVLVLRRPTSRPRIDIDAFVVLRQAP